MLSASRPILVARSIRAPRCVVILETECVRSRAPRLSSSYRIFFLDAPAATTTTTRTKQERDGATAAAIAKSDGVVSVVVVVVVADAIGCACIRWWWGCGGEESRFGPSWRLTPHSDSWPATSLRAGSASLYFIHLLLIVLVKTTSSTCVLYSVCEFPFDPNTTTVVGPQLYVCGAVAAVASSSSSSSPPPSECQLSTGHLHLHVAR